MKHDPLDPTTPTGSSVDRLEHAVDEWECRCSEPVPVAFSGGFEQTAREGFGEAPAGEFRPLCNDACRSPGQSCGSVIGR